VANDLTRRPWIIDTPSATNITNDRVRLGTIRWVGAGTAAAGAAVVADGAGRVVWENVASGANTADESVLEFDVEGLRVPTLAAGKLYIYYL
jgi:hypothetical protein